MDASMSETRQWIVERIHHPFFFKISFGLIFITSLLFKTIYLSNIPTSFHPDELMYLVQAKSFFLQGTDLSGHWKPQLLNTFNQMYAELPSAIWSLGYLFTSNLVIGPRIISVILGTSITILITAIIHKIHKNKYLALLTFFVFSFSPFILQMSRMTFDVLPALFFYLVGIAISFYLKGWKRIFALPFYILGFFQYQGFKIILLPLVIATEVFYQHYFQPKTTTACKKSAWLPSAVNILSIFILLIIYLTLILPNQAVSGRISNQTILGPEYQTTISGYVNTERRLSVAPKFIGKVFTNKITVLTHDRLSELASIFNPKNIYLINDPSVSGFSVWSHGLLYPLELFILPVALMYLFRKQKLSITLLWMSFLLIGSMPSLLAANNSWFMFRSMLTYFTLTLLTAYGIYYLLKTNTLLFTGTIIIYLFSIIYFGYQFFYRFPVYSANGNYFRYKVLGSYVGRLPQDELVTIHSSSPEGLYLYYLYYNNLIIEENLDQIKDNLSRGEYSLNNVTFTTDCVSSDDTHHIIYQAGHKECMSDNQLATDLEFIAESEKATLTISSLLDGGGQFEIMNDELCSAEKLNSYPRLSSVRDFSVVEQSNSQFCLNNIVDVKP